MIRAAAILGAVLCIALGFAIWRLDAMAAQLETARAQLEGAQEAARFARAQAARDRAAVRLDVELQEGSGADAPLSDYLRSGASRVWPSSGAP